MSSEGGAKGETGDGARMRQGMGLMMRKAQVAYGCYSGVGNDVGGTVGP